MNVAAFHAIAERTLELRGPAERLVVVRIGAPEPDLEHPGSFRCPYQVTGLSSDIVRFAVGVDTLQALNLSFAGIRRELETNASVLAAFHEDFSLTWEGGPWEAAIPVWVPLESAEEEQQFQAFKARLWEQRIAARRSNETSIDA